MHTEQFGDCIDLLIRDYLSIPLEKLDFLGALLQAFDMKIEQLANLRVGVRLAEFSTFGMGGAADYLVETKTVEELVSAIRAANQDGVPYFVLGWGSNVIFDDQGFRGLIIRNLARKVELENGLIVAESGALLSQIIQFAIKNKMVGMEKMMGLPGTIGGAVRGNAGAFGLETKDLVEKVEVWNEKTGLQILAKNDLEFSYRDSLIKRNQDLITRVWLKLELGDVQKGIDEIRQITISRLGKQPAGKTCGSYFKNPSGNSVAVGLAAGAAIDACGLKGRQVGGIKFSEKHANWLMNCGEAKMADILEITKMAQDAVEEKYGIRLEREVLLLGENGVIK